MPFAMLASTVRLISLATSTELQVELVARVLLDRLLRARAELQLDAAARVVRRIEVAEQQVGVGHRRLQAAAVVAGRAGIGAGALRTDLDAS